MKRKLSVNYGITTKMMLMNLLLLAVFVAIIMLTFYSFGTVERLVNRTVATDVELNLANAGVLRELTEAFSNTSRLLGSFIKNEKELAANGGQIVASTERLAAVSSDKRLSEPLQKYSMRLGALFATCASINVIVRQIEQQEEQHDRIVEALERTISDNKIRLILKGHDPAIMEQLAVLTTGYHDSLQAVSLSFFRTISEKSAQSDSSRQKQQFDMIDDIILRLQSLSASEPQIAVYGPRLIASVKAYRVMIEQYFRALKLLELQKSQLEEAKVKVIGVMQRIDGEIASSTKGISSHVHEIMVASRRNILLVAVALAVVSGFGTLLFIFTTIRRPMAVICKGIEDIAAGNLETRISLNRHDEWNNIEQALNHMAAELRRSYSELAQQHDQLEVKVQERTRELEDAQAELVKREKLSVLGQLTATVSHELRNPLGVIRSSAFYLRNRLGSEDDKVVKHLARIEQHVILCDGIVGDLLEFTRGQLSAKAPGNLNVWLEGILNIMQVPTGIVLEHCLDGDLPLLRFDPDKLRRVVQNLVNNASHAVADRAGKDAVGGYAPGIVVSTSCGEGVIQLVVEDNGCGMDSDTVERAFEPLFTTRAQGTGLGLAIVRKIVEEHGGSVAVASRPGYGTQVTVTLPTDA